MSNDEVYASGLLNRALDPATQPPEIRAFMQTEIEQLKEFVAASASWLDVGCGTGRHLALLHDRRFAVGVDYEHAYIVEARRLSAGSRLHYVTGDATRMPVRVRFDLATCLTNSWGTMADKGAVLDEMRRCARRVLLSVFSPASVPARREWYRRFGHPIVEETADYVLTEGGLRSEHFSKARLRALVGDCTIEPCTDIAYSVTF